MGPSTSRVIAVGATLIAIFYAAGELIAIRGVFLAGFLAVLISAVLSYPVDILSRTMARGFAVILTLAVVVGAVVGLVVLMAPFVADQVKRLVQDLPAAADRLDEWIRWTQRDSVAPRVREQVGDQLGALVSQLVPFAFSLVEIVFGVVIVLALAAFLVYQSDAYRLGLRRLVPNDKKPLLDETWHRLSVALRHWMVGILVSMTLMGTFTAIGLLVAGIEGWFALGLLTFFGTFVPYAGAIASAIPGLAVGLAQSPVHFVYALVVYVAVHILEGYFVEPLVMQKAVALRPGLQIFWQAAMAALFGALGIVVATPLLAAVVVLTDYWWVERHIEK